MSSALPPFAELVRTIGYVVDLLAVAAITLGIVLAGGFTVRRWRARTPGIDLFRDFRRDVGRAILLGLELFVAADILRMVVIAPTVDNVLVLATIVAVRTFLSFSLEIELYGIWPWKRGSNPGKPT